MIPRGGLTTAPHLESKHMSHQWLYKDSIENGVMVLLEDVEKYQKDGYVYPEDLGKEVAEESDDDSLESMSKEDLKTYALAQFGVTLNKQKSHANLIKEIEALEDN